MTRTFPGYPFLVNFRGPWSNRGFLGLTWSRNVTSGQTGARFVGTGLEASPHWMVSLSEGAGAPVGYGKNSSWTQRWGRTQWHESAVLTVSPVEVSTVLLPTEADSVKACFLSVKGIKITSPLGHRWWWEWEGISLNILGWPCDGSRPGWLVWKEAAEWEVWERFGQEAWQFPQP